MVAHRVYLTISNVKKIVGGIGSLEDSLEGSQTTFAAFSMGSRGLAGEPHVGWSLNLE